MKNKLVIIIASVIVILGLSKIIELSYLSVKTDNWENENAELIHSVENSTKKYFKNLIDSHLLLSQSVIEDFANIEKFDFKKIDSLQNKISKPNLSISILNVDDSLVYWNKYYYDNIWEKENWKYSNGEVHFIKTEIYAYIAYRDSIRIGNESFNVLFAEVIDKQFKLNEDFFSPINLSDQFTTEFELLCEINFNPAEQSIKDGRYFTIEIKNNFGNKIGSVEYTKPTRGSILEKKRKLFSDINNSLILILFLSLGVVLYKTNIFGIEKFYKILLSIIFIVFLRYLFIYTGFPNYLFTSPLLTDEYYHSNFAYGIAASPVELTITLIAALMITTLLFLFIVKRFEQNKVHKNIERIIIILFSLVLYVFIVRGIGAAVRGIVFDSTIRYFTSASFNVTPQHLLMQFNLLLLGLICVGLSIALFIIIFNNIFPYVKSLVAALFISAILLLISEVGFTLVQQNPQLTFTIKSLLIIVTAVIAFIIIQDCYKSFLKFVIIFFFGSIFSITALLFYNTELEKYSLKATASIISRYDDNWYKELIKETLISNVTIDEARIAFEEVGNNFNASAFKIWSNSQLQKEAINSSVNFFDLSGNLLGGFGSVYPTLSLNALIDTTEVIEEIQLFEEPTDNQSEKLIRGIFPIKDEYSFLGYVDISILSSLENFGFSSHPDFISTGKLNDKAILKLDKFIILDYRDQKLTSIYGTINPTQKISDIILENNFSHKNDKWLNLSINGSNYLAYVLKSIHSGYERVLAVALRDKELSISLFDFFKVFFSHTVILIIILLFYFVYFISTVQRYKINLRSKLILAFLIISVIPLVLTAIFFRNLTESKNREAIYYKLGKRAFSVEEYLTENRINGLDFTLLNKASQDLNINYSLFRNNKLIYSSHDLLYDVGILSDLVNPNAYTELIIDNAQEILIDEQIDKYRFNSFYYKASLIGDNFIIKVTDGFNKIRLPLSGSEVDVFLFGFYSLTVVLIIIFSFVFANQISLPIRKITNATKSVAAGDLSLEINANASGELADLEDGFNYMIKELKRNQTMLAEIEREEAWKEMAKQVAHEIKNPLTPMKLSIQQLITAYDDKSDKFEIFFRKITSTILNQIETLKNIATEFSNFARMPKLKIEQIDFSLTISAAIDLFSNQNVKLTKHNFPKNLLIKGDSEQMKRSVINLIRNSIQAGATEIDFIFSEDTDSIKLDIKDNGKGIPDEITSKIFEPNFTTKIKGMGLGLSLVKRYINSMNGEIKILQTSPNGTIIQLVFLK